MQIQFESDLNCQNNVIDSKVKINCGVEHFKAISEDIKFIQSDTFDNMKEYF